MKQSLTCTNARERLSPSNPHRTIEIYKSKEMFCSLLGTDIKSREWTQILVQFCMASQLGLRSKVGQGRGGETVWYVAQDQFECFNILQYQETLVKKQETCKLLNHGLEKMVQSGIFKTPRDYSLVILWFSKLQSLFYPNTHDTIKSKYFANHIICYKCQKYFASKQDLMWKCWSSFFLTHKCRGYECVWDDLKLDYV